jgi:ElaB/YqjD/DUF883 family membrane-anchored ribosome-binding protein
MDQEAAESGKDHLRAATGRISGQDLQAEGEAYVRDNPTKAVFIALGAGFVLGLLLRK